MLWGGHVRARVVEVSGCYQCPLVYGTGSDARCTSPTAMGLADAAEVGEWASDRRGVRVTTDLGELGGAEHCGRPGWCPLDDEPVLCCSPRAGRFVDVAL